MRCAQAAGATKLHYEIARASQGVDRCPPPVQLRRPFRPRADHWHEASWP